MKRGHLLAMAAAIATTLLVLGGQIANAGSLPHVSSTVLLPNAAGNCSEEFPGSPYLITNGTVKIQYNGLRAFVGSTSGTMEFDGPTQSFGEFNASPSGGVIPISGVEFSNRGTWTVFVYDHLHHFVCSGTFTTEWVIADVHSAHSKQLRYTVVK